jgi:glycosyltransferase involved in cell wall biosynthesis
LLKLIDAHDIELIHSHDDKTLLYGWMLKWFRPKVRIMYTCHLHSAYTRKDFDSFRGYLAFMARTRIQIFLMKQYKKPLLSVSEFTKKTLVSHGLREKDVTVLHNGIDTDQWQKNHGTPVLRNEFDQLKNALIVGTVARIDQKHKDLPTFYRVAAAVSRKWPDVRFVIVGDGHGKLLDETKKMVFDLGLKDIVFFTGHRTDLLNIYSSFDVFLMTSRTEGLPNTVLEAMSMEVPVVSTRVAGVPERKWRSMPER